MPKERTIALVGRTNVGKSTLFNKLVEENRALVSAMPNVTRDRNYGEIIWRGEKLRVVDTGGLDAFVFLDEEKEKYVIEKQILEQTNKSLVEADLVLVVVNARDGVMPQEKALVKILQQINKPTILVCNKVDSNKIFQDLDVNEFIKLNLGEPYYVSAKSGRGTGDLLDYVFDQLETIPKKKTKKIVISSDILPIKISLIGKPNVGKSSLLNALLDEEYAITSPMAHTTREPHDAVFNYKKQPFMVIDTAGIRKKAQIKKKLEKVGVNMSLDTLDEADVAILVLDVSEPLATQDNYLANQVKKSGCGLIVVANKWDLIEGKETNTINEYTEKFYRRFPYLWWAPILFTSALTKLRAKNILDMAIEVNKEKYKKIEHEELEIFTKKIIEHHKPIRGKGTIRPRVKDFEQVSTNPPTFVLHVYPGADLHKSYLKYIENQLRKAFSFSGVPIRIKIDQPIKKK